MKLARYIAALAAWAVAVAPAAAQVPSAVPTTPAARAAAPVAQGPVAPRPGGRLAPGEPLPAVELEAFIDGVIRDAMATDHLAGATVAIVQGGQPVLIKGYGMARPGVAVDPQRHLFRIASVSKTFTWILLMREVEAGRIRLEAPINDYLPVGMKIPDEGFEKPIRVIDMMAHSAGFEDTALGHLFTLDPAQVTTLETYVRNHRPRRVREPGLFSTYCNWCTAVTGYIVARSAGAPDFETLAERDVFRPLGMTSTTFRMPYPARTGLAAPMPAALAERLSTGFKWTGAGFKPAKFEFGSLGPAGSVSTTAPDMARYMLMHLNGGTLDGATVFGPRTARAFRTPVMKEAKGVNGWAHGLMIQSAPGGFTAYGHGGALSDYFTNMLVYPELGLGVFVSTNTNTGRPLIERLPSHIVARFYAPASETLLPPDPKLKERAERYVGSYLGTRRSYTGLEGFVYLIDSGAEVSVGDDGYLTVTGGGGARQYVPDGRPDGFVTTDGRSRLTFNVEGGKAHSFRSASGTQTFERASGWRNFTVLGIAAALAMLAALATIIGAFTRIGRDIRPTPGQRLANLLSLVTASAWLVGAGVFGAWAMSALEGSDVLYNWPGPWVITASSLALVSSLLSAALLLGLPLAWRGSGRRGEGWTIWRKLRHTAGVLCFSFLGAMLLALGALQPWSS